MAICRRSRRCVAIGMVVMVMIFTRYQFFAAEDTAPFVINRAGTSRKLNARFKHNILKDITKSEPLNDNSFKSQRYAGEMIKPMPPYIERSEKDLYDSGFGKNQKLPSHKLYVVPGKILRRNAHLHQRNFYGMKGRSMRAGFPHTIMDIQGNTLNKSQKRTPFLYRKDDPVAKAPKASSGEPWPAPQIFLRDSSLIYSLDPSLCKIEVSGSDCDVLNAAIIRYKERVQVMHSGLNKNQELGNNYRSVRNINIEVSTSCSNRVYPSMDSDESYELSLNKDSIILRATEVWGAVYGLETLSQLVREESGVLLIDGFSITDFPRFKHRGIMIDSSRHFLSVQIIKKNLDAMVMNKFNVLHWHIVDDQSFPYVSKVFPELSVKGAFSASAVYTIEDITEIIEYARLRAIRVIPEFDTPGHVQSWLGLKHILTPCDTESSYGPIDPSNNLTYSELRYLFSEILQVFPGQTIHFGGDECSYYCWSKSEAIKEFMKQNSMGEDYTSLYGHFIKSLRRELSENNLKPKNSIYWQEIYDEDVKIDEDDILQVWKADHELKLSQITMRGHKVILSSCWYLNYIKYGTDWKAFYRCDPLRFSGNPDQKKLVLGGEACMWGEYVDDTNILPMLWPRAIAVAERLWSSFSRNNATEAAPRFEEHRCRLVRNGIAASPNSGPGPTC